MKTQTQNFRHFNIFIACVLAALALFSGAPAHAIHKDEIETMVQFYKSTGGSEFWNKLPRGLTSSGWDGTEAGDPCLWKLEGRSVPEVVKCDADERVTELDFGGIGMRSTQLPSLKPLLKLTRVNFYNNHLGGRIPELPDSLITFGGAINKFTGELPDTLPEKINVFNVANNLLTGRIPELPDSLFSFKVANNLLTGRIPDTLPENIEYFEAANNLLTGEIIAELPASMEFFLVGGNMLEGMPPAPRNLRDASLCPNRWDSKNASSEHEARAIEWDWRLRDVWLDDGACTPSSDNTITTNNDATKGSIACEPSKVGYGKPSDCRVTDTAIGYEFDKALVFDPDNVASATSCTETGCTVQTKGDVRVSGVFRKIDAHKVNIKANEGGTVDCGGVTEVEHGDSLNCTITPNAGYWFNSDRDLSPDFVCDAQNKCTISKVTSAVNVEATFHKHTNLTDILLSEVSGGPACGDVQANLKFNGTPDDGKFCIKLTIEQGTSKATVTSPVEQSVLNNFNGAQLRLIENGRPVWSGDFDSFDKMKTNEPFSLTISAGDWPGCDGKAKTVRIRSCKEPKLFYNVTSAATPAEGGTFTCPDTINAGEVATCTAKPVGNFTFTDDADLAPKGAATVDCIKGTNTCLISGVNEDVTVTGIFNVSGSVPSYKVTGVAAPTEGGMFTCPKTIRKGEEGKCTADPAVGYTFTDSASVSPIGAASVFCPKGTKKCTISNVNKDVTVTGKFAKDGDSGRATVAVVSINNIKNTMRLQPGKANAVKFSVVAADGSPFRGEGNLKIWHAIQKASLDSESVTITNGEFTTNITPEEGDKIVSVKLSIPSASVEEVFSFEVARSVGAAAPVPTMSEIGLLLSGIALAGAAVPALRRRERRQGKERTRD